MVIDKPDDSLLKDAGLFVSNTEHKKHVGHIVSIAQEKGRPFSEVAGHYESVLAELKPRARVPDYLDVFVTRRVLELLKN